MGVLDNNAMGTLGSNIDVGEMLLPDNQTSVAAFIPYRFLQETQFGILTVVPSFLNFLEAELLYLADHLP